MFKIFFEVEFTRSLFDTILKDVNDLTNLISLHALIYAIYNNSSILLISFAKQNEEIRVLGNQLTNYLLNITYSKGKVTVPELITSTRILPVRPETASTVLPVLSGSLVKIEHPTTKDSQKKTPIVYPLPSSSYFALHNFVMWLQLTCSEERNNSNIHK